MNQFNSKILIVFLNFVIIFSEIDFVQLEKNSFESVDIPTFDVYANSINKTFLQKYEEQRSRQAYAENLKRIRQHNALYEKGKTSFKLRANCFADLNSQRYLKEFVRLEDSARPNFNESDADREVGLKRMQSLYNADGISVPESFDWREMGFRTPLENQLNCGACYAFSIAQSIEGQIFKRIGKLIPLSAQQIVDCSISIGNHGCHGGSLRNTLKYLQKFGGLMRKKDYPYMSRQGLCQFVKELSIVNVTSWAILPAGDEEAIRIAVAAIGPVAISINAAPDTFQLYSHGIYDDPKCSSSLVNHAMLVVGYTPKYWILKNWWGNNWGVHGYMKIERNKNRCGLANFAAYAVV